MMAEETVSTSCVFVYKNMYEDGSRKFVTFHADDILTIEQCFWTSPENNEKQDVSCVILKCSDPHMGHLHLDVTFHELMLRWMNYKESKEAK